MNLHKLFIEETNQFHKYVEWLEARTQEKVELEKSVTTFGTTIPRKTKTPKDYETIIDYDNQKLSYQVRVDFPRGLKINERERVEGIINYWSALPFVSVEGNYGIDWIFDNIVVVDIDFTKSASDDYMAHEILEKLAEWIWKGTPIRKRTNDQKWEGVIKPTRVSADCP